ncbi:MAG: hypothetical protein M0Z53_08415 [Thermaerobacter sp.]|nr:hypothetical protein [Thermaerobacter sp.]
MVNIMDTQGSTLKPLRKWGKCPGLARMRLGIMAERLVGEGYPAPPIF